jgi:hypothetical protein
VAGHAGVAPRPLAKVASGGELARISLAISVITSNATTVPTLIFDEVDSGIGGGVAEVVGRLLKRLGQEPPGAVRDPPAAGGQPGQPALPGRQGHDRRRQDGLAHRRARTTRRAWRKWRACWAGSRSRKRRASMRASCWRPDSNGASIAIDNINR